MDDRSSKIDDRSSGFFQKKKEGLSTLLLLLFLFLVRFPPLHGGEASITQRLTALECPDVRQIGTSAGTRASIAVIPLQSGLFLRQDQETVFIVPVHLAFLLALVFQAHPHSPFCGALFGTEARPSFFVRTLRQVKFRPALIAVVQSLHAFLHGRGGVVPPGRSSC